jgi:hypothetical protein
MDDEDSVSRILSVVVNCICASLAAQSELTAGGGIQQYTVAVCPHGNSMFEGEGEQLLNVLFIYFASHGTSLFRLILFFRFASTLWQEHSTEISR